MWWQAVFWILLIPLIVIELIVFLKSRKFSWLLFAASVFTYIVAVCYTIDVFKMGRNGIILTLLASAVLMFIIGRMLGKKVKKEKSFPKTDVTIAIAIAVIMVVVFAVSVIFGKLTTSTAPVASVALKDVMIPSDKGEIYPSNGVKILTTTATNDFILPVPVKEAYYSVCIETENGLYQLGKRGDYGYDQYPEVPARSTKSFDYSVEAYRPYESGKPSRILVYAATMETQWMPCDDKATPLYTIPIV
jgi:hypothetical protein